MVSKSRIRDKMHFLKKTLAEIRQVVDRDRGDFLEDTLAVHATTRMLQISIEATLDIAQHIVARMRLGTPKTYGEAMRLLADGNIIPEDLLPVLLQMVRFRNRVVHLYTDVSPDEILRIATNHLTDFERFIAAISQYVWDEAEEA